MRLCNVVGVTTDHTCVPLTPETEGKLDMQAVIQHIAYSELLFFLITEYNASVFNRFTL